MRRVWALVSPVLVGATAAATLVASATILPSFATTLPVAEASTAPVAEDLAQLEDAIPRLLAERQEALAAAEAEIGSAEQGMLLNNHHNQVQGRAKAVRTEIARLRNLSNFLWPTEGSVSSGFGYRIHPILRTRKLHNGADIGGACNNPIYAAQSGRVIKTGTGFSGGSGNNVRIDHGSIEGRNIQTAYLHMTRFIVKAGQRVSKGDLIGYVGSTGLSTACHLHLSLYKDGVGSDPLEYVKK